MSICIVTVKNGINPTQLLAVSDIIPCNGTLLLDSTDLAASFGAVEVFALFGACASLYALTFVINMALRQLGVKS